MKTLNKILILVVITSSLIACNHKTESFNSTEKESSSETNYELVLASEVEWTHLNPARGDLAPKAGTLWGDRKGTEATGFLLKPTDGFESPPHIHNVSYRGIVINGFIHNDDPDAENMWMPAGSFWTQPKGEVHITAAKSSNTFAYIEIDKGPYLVLPAEEHFDSGERPVNVDKTNMVWLDASDIVWVDQAGISSSNNGPKVAFLWANEAENDLKGTLIKLPANFKGQIYSENSEFRSILVKGEVQYKANGMDFKNLEPGSYFSSDGKAEHKLISSPETESIIYVRSNGQFGVMVDQQ